MSNETEHDHEPEYESATERAEAAQLQLGDGLRKAEREEELLGANLHTYGIDMRDGRRSSTSPTRTIVPIEQTVVLFPIADYAQVLHDTLRALERCAPPWEHTSTISAARAMLAHLRHDFPRKDES